MADLKVTKMVMKVDLQCSKCYRKIKKVLCRYPQIRDQVYNEKQNTLTITVVCCSPEKIKEKIACKAGDTVESIEIVPDMPEKPKPAEKPEKPKPAEKPEKPKPTEKPEKPKPTEKPEKPMELPKPEKPQVVIVEQPPPGPVPIFPVGVCCCCYEGRPCYHGRGPMCYDGCVRPAYECFSEENASGCSVM